MVLASDKDWHSAVLDCEGQVDNEICFDAQSSFLNGPTDKSFDEVGNYRFTSNKNQLFIFDAETFNDHGIDNVMQSFVSWNNATTKSDELEHELLKPLFNWMPSCITKKTFQLSTQHAKTLASYVMKKTHRSPFPTLNVKRRSEPVATETVFVMHLQ